jgi:GNAT superfamily N-acetyltransferase
VAINLDIKRSGFTVRPAIAADARPLRMLLPGLSDASARFVAVESERQLVIGAAVAARTFRMQPAVGPGISLHVIEPCRRQGIARSLLSQLKRVAQGAGARALYGAHRVDDGSEEMLAWQRLGFAPCEKVEEHVLPIDQFEQRLGPLVERMRTRGRIPANAQITPLYKADLAQVLQLHLDVMGGDRAELYRKLRGRGSGAYLPRQSCALIIDGQVKGCILGRRTSRETIVIDANIVEPSLRGGWANAWLKLAAFRGHPPGLKEFRFTSFDHYTDTRSFTEKLGGRILRTTLLMMCRLPATRTE